jgi:hypothetical protein
MHRKLFIGILVILVLLSPAAALAGGDIYVGGPYGTKITSVPYTISAPGAYYLGGNLTTAPDSTGIFITADNVTLDLMGFTLSGSGIDNFGIYMHDRKNVEIRNGTVSGWNTGIYEDGMGLAHRVINVRVVGNIYGIWLKGSCHLIRACLASARNIAPTGYGLVVTHGTVQDCQVKNYSQAGIRIEGAHCTIVSGNVVTNATDGYGITALGPALLMANAVANCQTGIYAQSAASFIGNTVSTFSGQTGIAAPNAIVNPTLMDQNTVTGGGTHYSWGSGTVAWRNNAGYP